MTAGGTNDSPPRNMRGDLGGRRRWAPQAGMGASARICALVLCVRALPHTAAMRGEDDLDVSGGVFGRWYAFGALTDAQFHMYTGVDNPGDVPPGQGVWSLVCSWGQFQWLLNADQNAICNTRQNLSNVCYQGALLGSGLNGTVSSWELDTAVQSADFYQFLLLSCTSAEVHLSVSYHFVNPGGEELSSGAIPIKGVTRGFTVVWGVLGVMLVGNLLYAKLFYRGRTTPDEEFFVDPAVLSPIRTLHYALLTTLVLKALDAGIALRFWLNVSESGVVDVAAQWGSLACRNVASACLIAIVLLISRGWQVTRLSVDGFEYRHVGFMVLFYVGSWLTWQAMEQFFWLFLLVLCYIFMIRYLFASVAWRVRLLQGFRSFVNMLGISRGPAPEPAGVTFAVMPGTEAHETQGLLPATASGAHDARHDQLPQRPGLARRAWSNVSDWWRTMAVSGDQGNLTSRQIRALLHFRTAVLLYLLMDVLSQVWGALAMNTHPWVSTLLSSLWNVLMVVYLLVVFRASSNPDKSVLYDPRGYAGASIEQLLQGPANGADQAPIDAPRRIIIQNPDSFDATGQPMPSVVLAELTEEIAPAQPRSGGESGSSTPARPPARTPVDAASPASEPAQNVP